MEGIQQRNILMEEAMKNLRDEVTLLTQLIEQRQKVQEQKEVALLKEENLLIRNNIYSLKRALVYWEAQNGIKQIPLPAKTCVATVPSAPACVALAPSENLDQAKEANQGDAKKNGAGKGKEVKAGEPKKAKTENKKAVAEKSSGNPDDEADDNREITVSRLNMKVGKIVGVKKHPDADSLYVEEVDLGEGKNRTIVSGLVKFVPIEEMQGRLAVFLVNLKAAKMRGVLSEGMIMCASTPAKVEILEVPPGAQIGDQVVCPEYPGDPDVQLNAKKKIWEQIQPGLRVTSDGVAAYKGGAFTVKGKGVCRAPTLRDCPIK